MPQEGILKVLNLAKADRAAGKQVLIVNMKKNKKFQKDNLTAQGYKEFRDIYREELKH